MTTLAQHSIELSGGSMQTISGAGVRAELPALVARICQPGTVVVLHDGAPKSLADGTSVLDSIHDLLAPREQRDVQAVAGTHGVVLDEATVTDATEAARGAAGIVSVGSGTITDLAKVVAAAVGAPLIAVQTAASVNGFSDPLSVLVVNGAKRTLPSTWPAVLIIDSDIVRAAPHHLTASGVGDAVAIWSAPADWYLACGLGMDAGPYDDRWITPVVEAAESLGQTGDADARLAGLIDALTVGGLVIGGAGSTAPLSGCEHLMSHVLDMAAMAEDAEHDLHGAQVGVSSIISSVLWDIASSELRLFEHPAAAFAPPADLEARVLATWLSVDPSGKLGAECWTAVQKKVARWNAQSHTVEAFFANSAQHIQRLRELAPGASHPADTLRSWDAPMTFADLTPAVSEERARWALAALPFMRDRFTLADLLLFAGAWNETLFDRVFAVAQERRGGLK